MQVAASFEPYVPVAQPRTTIERIGPLERLQWRVRLDCLIAACLPPNPIREGRKLVLFHPARLRFRTRAGATRSVTVQWPTLELASRLRLRVEDHGAGLPIDERQGRWAPFPRQRTQSDYHGGPARTRQHGNMRGG